MLTCRRLSNAEACTVFRIGAIAWLARVALRPDERVALVRYALEDAR